MICAATEKMFCVCVSVKPRAGANANVEEQQGSSRRGGVKVGCATLGGWVLGLPDPGPPQWRTDHDPETWLEHVWERWLHPIPAAAVETSVHMAENQLSAGWTWLQAQPVLTV